MSIPLIPYVKAIVENNSFGVTGVFHTEEIGIYEYTNSNVENLKKLLETGKFDLIDSHPKAKNSSGENMTLIRFKDGNGYLFFALLYNTKDSIEEPKALIVTKAFFYNISPEHKATLLTEFNKLKSVKQKMQFFINKLGINYIDFIENLNYYQEIQEFEFSGYNHKENWKEINEWILDNYKPKNKKDPIFLNITQLKKDFKENLSVTRNKEDYIYTELKRIEKSFTQYSTEPIYFGSGIIINVNTEFNADFETYEDYYKYKKEPDLSIQQPRLTIISFVNGKTLAEYRIFVEAELQRLKKGKTSNNIEQDLTVQQKALLLHISGFLDGMDGDNSNKARILAPLLNIGEKSFYDAILKVNSPDVRKDDKNLKAILEFLEDQGEKNIKKLVASELKKLTN